MNRLIPPLAGGIALLAAGAALAQSLAGPSPTAPPAIANPTYVTLVVETTVDRLAETVWARVGKFCDIAEWMGNPCTITSGTLGELGAVRKLGNGVVEMLVAKTPLSYTYAQPVRTGVPYNAYHGTIEARPVTPKTSRLIYSFFYDNSMLADDAARAAEIENRRSRFTQALKNMKTLAEGGTLPPAR